MTRAGEGSGEEAHQSRLELLFPARDWTSESLSQAHLQFLALTYPLECWRPALELKLHRTECKYVNGKDAQSHVF